MLSGQATAAGTQARTSRFPDLASATLGRTGWRVSQAGFGGYRIDVVTRAHHAALKHALCSGINLIDTSSNYANGHSEILIGQVLGELVQSGDIRRDEVVVVSKAGYIQGKNYALAQERARQGNPFQEVVTYQEGLWHCLHPEFLADQLRRSLERLQLTSLDVFLLHNPEYFLQVHADRAEYERRIREAFRFLETQVAAGTIGCYGVSSNTFPDPSQSPTFTSLEKLLEMASDIDPEHHFQVIQFPANLFEPGFVLEPNQSGKRTLLGLAREADLGVLINRPLNARTEHAMVRLTDFPAGRTLDQAALQSELRNLGETERMLLASDPEDDALRQCLVIGPMIEANWSHIQGLEHWQEVVAYHLIKRLEGAVRILSGHPAIHTYRDQVMAIFQRLNGHFFQTAHERAMSLHAQLNPVLPPEWRDRTLSQKAIGLLQSLEGVDCVLVGMRSQAYVDDVLEALRGSRLGDAGRVWESLAQILV